MLWVSYSMYQGGHVFHVSDLPEIIMFFLAPLVIAGVISGAVRIFKSGSSVNIFTLTVSVVSALGVFINSFAAYLIWWSTTQ